MLGTEELFPWVEQVCDGQIVGTRQTSGGNRCIGWVLDIQPASSPLRRVYLRYQTFSNPAGGPYTVRREAEAYAALRDTGVAIPRLVAVHPTHHAMLAECARGTAEYRGVADGELKASLARECMGALARLHAVDAASLPLPNYGRPRTVADAVRAELDTWYAMYLASGRADPLIEFGYVWLQDHLPPVLEPPVFVHGDAGPGNFMFDAGHLTALTDWELGHLGDPMEDLAWFSLRSVLEPAPDFPVRLLEYAAASGRPVELDRVRYHRAFVSWRVVIIRHCNVSGRAGASVISRALNRRLLIEAIDAVEGRPSGARSPEIEAIASRGAREYDGIFDQTLEDIRVAIVPQCDDKPAVALKAKDVAKAIKFMRELYTFGPDIERWEIGHLQRQLGTPVDALQTGRIALAAQIAARRLGARDVQDYLRQAAAADTLLASGSMGALATRSFPPLMD